MKVSIKSRAMPHKFRNGTHFSIFIGGLVKLSGTIAYDSGLEYSRTLLN